MSFDRVARVYHPLELLILGRALQECRTAFLARATHAGRALILGEGDGRFLEALLLLNPVVRVDCLDGSASMISTAKHRLNKAGLGSREGLAFYHAGALSWQPPGREYDLIVTHFFFDCFEPGDTEKLIARTATVAAPGAVWLMAEFNLPARGLLRWRAALWVRFLYLVFGVLTGISARQLPDFRSPFRQAGLHLEAERLTKGGLLASRVWRRPGNP